MEEQPREMELNFGNADKENLDSAVENPAADTETDHSGGGIIDRENASNMSAPVQNSESPAAATSPVDSMLRSRYPANRPAGTLPLNSGVHEQITTLEMAISGKSYGSALRILREQNNLTYKELEQVTMIQPRFQEALENERPDQPLVYVIAQIRTLCRFYKLSNATSDALVAKLKEQLEYSCNDEIIGSLDVDRSGAEANERKLKKILFGIITAAVAVVLLITVLAILLSGGCSSDEMPQSPAEKSGPASQITAAPGDNAEKFDSTAVYSLLEPPTLDLPKLPVAE